MNDASTQEADVKHLVLELARAIGRLEYGFTILGEGNVSGRVDDKTFWVKASGGNLAALEGNGLVLCMTERVRAILVGPEATDERIEAELLAARFDDSAKKPSVEAMFHAGLLSLPGVSYVAHAHPVVTNQIMCSPRAREFAAGRRFPDEVVCCGPESILVPYTDPGRALATAVLERVDAFMRSREFVPKVILLENHGAITLGATPAAAQAAMRMLEKAAAIFVGAVALGGPIGLSTANIARIAGRPDELYRQRELQL